jgi:pimeloyl-ACP methyl ester carboxylesterase
MAVHHPERVTRLAVSGSHTRFDGYITRVQEWVNALKPGDLQVPDESASPSPDGAGHWPVVIGRLQPMWAAEPSFTREQVASIKAPALVVIGDADIVTPEHAVEMFRTIPGAQLCIVPHAAHGIVPRETVMMFLHEAPARDGSAGPQLHRHPTLEQEERRTLLVEEPREDGR